MLKGTLRPVRSIPATEVKNELEQASRPGERNYGLLRSARQSTSPVEEFLHLDNILLMFCDMANCLDGLVSLAKRAIELNP